VQDVGGRRGWRIWADTADGNDLQDVQGARMFFIPRPVKAAWTAGKAGLAGASAVAGWLKGPRSS
jgi:hypothetical protein